MQMCTNILTFNVLKYNPTVLYQPPSKLLLQEKKEKKNEKNEKIRHTFYKKLSTYFYILRLVY